MALTHALLTATVAHARMRPKRNAFHYRVYYLCLPLRDMFAPLGITLLSLNRFNLFSLRTRDYGTGNNPHQWIREILHTYHVDSADGDVVLLTLPRVLGYGFNPVSFWFCLDRAGSLRAVLSEVRNTFGEKHCYLSFHDDGRVIGRDDIIEARKVFHVSPFIEVNGYYRFRFAYGEKRIGVWIDHHDADGPLLTTSLIGKRGKLTSITLLRCFFTIPLVTFKVSGLIYYQALRLFLKGIRYRRKPIPPLHEISR